MSDQLKFSVQIKCPVCSKIGNIGILENIVHQSESGLTAINVLSKLVCDHSFVAYIDKNLDVRDCFVCDFKVQLPQIQLELPSTPSGPPVDLDIIKYNLLPSLMANILIGVHFNRKIAIINELDFLNEKYLKFFEFLFQDSFKHDISFISPTEYKQHKKEYKNYLILQSNQILLDKKKMIDPKKFKIENSIIQRFYSDYDTQTSLIIFKNEITKLFKLSQDLIEINDNLNEKEDFTTKKAIMYINQKYKTKISHPYVNLLMDIIEQYFKVELKKASDSGDLLGLI